MQINLTGDSMCTNRDFVATHAFREPNFLPYVGLYPPLNVCNTNIWQRSFARVYTEDHPTHYHDGSTTKPNGGRQCIATDIAMIGKHWLKHTSNNNVIKLSFKCL